MGMAEHMMDHPGGTPALHAKELAYFWGTVLQSIFTLFKSVSGGISWQDAVEPLSHAGWLYVAVFIVFQVSTVFAIMNVITGVFCQSAMESAHLDKDQATMELLCNQDIMRAKFAEIFKALDRDSSGDLTIDELEQVYMQPQSLVYLQSL